jgi:hypothetical protein
VEVFEGRVHPVCLDAVVIEIEALVEGLIEVPADCVIALGVKVLGVRYEAERLNEHPNSDGKL